MEVCSERCAQKDKAIFQFFTCPYFVTSGYSCSTSLKDFERGFTGSGQMVCSHISKLMGSPHDRLLTLCVVSKAILWMIIRDSSD